MGLAQQSDAFDSCHTYKGANLRGEPMIKFEGNATGLAFVIASYIGLPSSTKKCDTPGCCNPFHYIPNGVEDRLVQGEEEKDRVLQIGLDEWVDLIDYEADKRAIRKEDVTFEMMRGFIPVEDLDDDHLKLAVERFKAATT